MPALWERMGLLQVIDLNPDILAVALTLRLTISISNDCFFIFAHLVRKFYPLPPCGCAGVPGLSPIRNPNPNPNYAALQVCS